MKNSSKILNESAKEKVKADNSLRLQKYREIQRSLLPYEDKSWRGYFGPESMFWTIFKEPALLLGGHRALLLQIAHPAIAQGVQQYSRFQKDFTGRATGTITSMTKIIFGSIDQAKASALKLHWIHSMIRGTYPKKIGNTAQNISFCANDPELLFWVLATIIDTALVVYEIVCRKLTRAEKHQFYTESKRMAFLMGIPKDYYPEDLNAFYIQYDQLLKGDEIHVGQTAIALADAIFKTPLSIPVIGKSLAAGLLNKRLRLDYKLNYSIKVYTSFIFLAKLQYKLIPGPLRLPPPYHQAVNRIAQKEKNKRIFPGCFFEFIAHHISSPFLLPAQD